MNMEKRKKLLLNALKQDPVKGATEEQKFMDYVAKKIQQNRSLGKKSDLRDTENAYNSIEGGTRWTTH